LRESGKHGESRTERKNTSREKRDRRGCEKRLAGDESEGSGTRRARLGERAHRERSAREDIDIFGRGARIAAATAAREGARKGGRRKGDGLRARRGSRLSLPDPAVSMATSSARISRERPEA